MTSSTTTSQSRIIVANGERAAEGSAFDISDSLFFNLSSPTSVFNFSDYNSPTIAGSIKV